MPRLRKHGTPISSTKSIAPTPKRHVVALALARPPKRHAQDPAHVPAPTRVHAKAHARAPAQALALALVPKHPCDPHASSSASIFPKKKTHPGKAER